MLTDGFRSTVSWLRTRKTIWPGAWNGSRLEEDLLTEETREPGQGIKGWKEPDTGANTNSKLQSEERDA